MQRSRSNGEDFRKMHLGGCSKMRRVKWFVAAIAMGTLFFGCKAKEKTAETQRPEKAKAEARAEPKAERPPPAPAQQEATASPPPPARAPGSDPGLPRAAPRQ